NLPGAAWSSNATFPDGSTGEAIIFSADRDPHDEIFMIRPYGSLGSEVQVTKRSNAQAWEPVFSPDGRSVLFESHAADGSSNGTIMTGTIGGASFTALTASGDDCRQPNWSSNTIVYQKKTGAVFQLWILDPSTP